MRKLVPIAAVLLLFLCSCREKEIGMDPAMLQSSTVSLQVNARMAFTYDSVNGQMAFNREKRQFRAGNDDMSGFFVITCSELPVKVGQEITADLRWTSGSSVKSAGGVRFKVVKYEDTGLVWLWCAENKTGAVVKYLN